MQHAPTGRPSRRPAAWWSRALAWFDRLGNRRVDDAIAAGFPPAWRRLLAHRDPAWHVLTRAERELVEELVLGFLALKHVEGARGFDVDEQMRVLVAAQAVVPLLGLAAEEGVAAALDHYRDVGTVVLHPTTVVDRREGRPTGTPRVMTDAPEHLLGQATLWGPVLLAWDQVERAIASPGTGSNVVFHEFAHKLDMRDGRVDGTPMLGDREQRQRWHDVATRELRLLRHRPDGVLRRYGATNPAEFFAVALEVFLDDPLRLAEHKPELYDALRDLLRQDPAARHRRLLPATA